MIRDIVLHGALGAEFGQRFRLDIETPAEAIRALIVMVPGFRRRFTDGLYRIIRGPESTGQQLGEDAVQMRLGAAGELHIVPVVIGSSGITGLGKLVAGLVLVGLALAAPYLLPETFGAGASALAAGALKATFAVGAALALGGIGMLLAKAPPGSTSSFIFNGQGNITTQGGPVPLVYGQTITGAVVISMGLETQQLNPQANPGLQLHGATYTSDPFFTGMG